MIIRATTLSDNSCWTFDSRISDFTDMAMWISGGWNSCYSGCFSGQDRYKSVVFNVNMVYGIFGEDNPA